MDFYRFTKEEFEKCLSETKPEFHEVDIEGTHEVVYEATSMGKIFTMRVWSTIDKQTGKARDKGSDAIRLVLLHTDSGQPLLKERRTNRIETWDKNLKKKINNLVEKQGQLVNCHKCGAYMVIRSRNSDGKKFYGCSRFPECRGIKNLDGDAQN